MKKVTYQQIADALQTSRVTVWKALNDKPGISPATRQAILLQAVSMGYPLSLLQPDNAPGLFVSQTALSAGRQEQGQDRKPVNVAVAVSRPETSNFWMSIIHYQAMTFAQSGINLIYAYLPPAFGESDTLPEVLTNGTVQGVIVMNVYDVRQIRAINRLSLPKVFLDCPSQMELSDLQGDLFILEGISSIDAIVRHMIDKGKKRIHFIGDIAYARTNRERYLGYLRGMQQNGLSGESLDNLISPIDIEAYPQTIAAYLDRLEPVPEAIVCASDYIAYQVVDHYRQKGVRIPEDILVSGYDDSYEFNTLIPLTTVTVNNARLGVHLAEHLVNRIRYPDDEYQLIYVRNKAIFRASTGE